MVVSVGIFTTTGTYTGIITM